MRKQALSKVPQPIKQGQLPKGKGGIVSKNYLNTGRGWIKIKDTDRNEKCGCGSGRKYKHCCL